MDECKIITANMADNGSSHTTNSNALNKIKLTVHIPENIQENVRQQKVNKIYDILNPEIFH